MRIYVTADLHYDERNPYKEYSDANLKEVVDRANALEADLLIAIGDMFHHGLQDNALPEPWHVRSEEEVLNVLDTLTGEFRRFAGKHGFIYVPGNHEAYAWLFEEYFGYRYKFDVIDDVLILVLCTSDLNSYWVNYVSAKQLSDLKTAIDGHSDKPALAFLHVPLYQTTHSEFQPWTHVGYWSTRNGDAVRSVLKNHPRLAAIVGAHIGPGSAFYNTDDLGLVHVYKRHTGIGSTPPYFTLRDDYVIDVDPATGAVDIDVWRYDYGDRVDVYSATV